MNNTVKIESDELTKLVFVSILCMQLLLPNGFYLFFCYAALLLLIYNLSQPFKPAVFSIIVVQHLLQVVAGVWLANYLNADLNYRSYFTDRATILSIVGIFFCLGQ
jgi:energy-coupling factor transporter transmembrane protein EcfT